MDSILDSVIADLAIDFADDATRSNFDRKIKGVKAYLKNAGASDTQINSDSGYSCILTGVSDLWNMEAGGSKFSQLFLNMAAQLALGGE